MELVLQWTFKDTFGHIEGDLCQQDDDIPWMPVPMTLLYAGTMRSMERLQFNV